MLTTEVKSMALTGNKSKQPSSAGGGGGGVGTAQASVTFRTPQQFVKKKVWNKNNRSKHNNHQDLENIQQNEKTSVKSQNKNKPVVAAKFYLSDKRPPKEIIVPPTKFLLGGNISDPLNLNSLQNETINSNNNTPVTTPRRSPISQQTPPKIDVIIPPNIHDPLHLLDPVDSMEYEKQLTSPMKRKTKSKHRNRKKKPKRRRLDSSSTTEFSDVFSGVSNGEELYEKTESENSFGSVGEKSFENSWEEDIEPTPSTGLLQVASEDVAETTAPVEEECIEVPSASQSSNILTDREKLITNLRLDLGKASFLLPNLSEDVSNELVVNCDQSQMMQQQQIVSPVICSSANTSGTGSAIGSNRKRKSSESQQQAGKNKQFRRLDSMDKIVSPVVPQPGAWKRPPHFVPTGARKGTRTRTTSHSETDILSPVEENKSGVFDDNSIRSDTPDADIKSFHGDDLKGSISPSSRGTTSAIAGSSIAPNHELPKFRKDGYKFQYGNYDRYVGYRNLNEFMDVRLQVFQQYQDIFKGKDVLDIGCNVGHMAIAIGRNFAPKSILGIDIDKDLISRARKNLAMYVRIPNNKVAPNQQQTISSKKGSNKKTKKDRHQQFQNGSLNVENHQLFPISFPICLGEIKSTSPKSDPFPSPHPAQPQQNPFPKNVFFRHTNYVLKDESLLNNDTPLYDVIVCLSVTKWIHLNYGDSGLKLAFKRMFNQLRPGGKLILEAQNWASYKKKKNLTENIYNNYRTIEFFPDYFHEYLLSNEVGFSHSYTLGVPRHLNKGFCRPIQLYAKGDFTPNHIQWSDAHHPQTPYETYRGIYAWLPRPMNYPNWGGSSADTPRGNSGSYSCRQTPLYAYNPLETDYLPSYGGIESLNRHYVFASPLYQTVWSPPASLKTPSNRTPHARSIRESDSGEDFRHNRHVYPPSTDDMTSPNAAAGAFNSIREADIEEGQSGANRHVYATNCESQSPVASPQTIDCELLGSGSDAEGNGFSPYGSGYD